MLQVQKMGKLCSALVFMLFTALTSLTFTGCGSDPEKEAGEHVVKYLNTLMSGNVEQAADMIYLPEPKAQARAMLLGKMGAIVPSMMEEAEAKGGIKNIVVEKVEKQTEEGKYVVYVRTEFGNGTNNQGKQTVITKDGKMYIGK